MNKKTEKPKKSSQTTARHKLDKKDSSWKEGLLNRDFNDTYTKKKSSKKKASNTVKVDSYNVSMNEYSVNNSSNQPIESQATEKIARTFSTFGSSTISGSNAFDTCSISSDSGISSGRTTPTASAASDSEAFDTSSISSESEISSGLKPTVSKKVAVNDDTSQQQLQSSGQQKFAGIRRGGRKVLSQRAPRKVEIPTVSKEQNNSAASEKKSPKVRNKPEQIKKGVEQTVSLDDQIKTLQNRQNDLRKKLDKLEQHSKLFMFIKSKKHKTEERELKSQLREVTKAKWRAELDKRFENDKGLEILDFVNRSRDTSNSRLCGQNFDMKK